MRLAPVPDSVELLTQRKYILDPFVTFITQMSVYAPCLMHRVPAERDFSLYTGICIHGLQMLGDLQMKVLAIN